MGRAQMEIARKQKWKSTTFHPRLWLAPCTSLTWSLIMLKTPLLSVELLMGSGRCVIWQFGKRSGRTSGRFSGTEALVSDQEATRTDQTDPETRQACSAHCNFENRETAMLSTINPKHIFVRNPVLEINIG